MTTLDDYVARVVAEAPPLTAEQAERIASLLRHGGPRPGDYAYAETPSQRERRERREAEARERAEREAHARKVAAAAMGCRGCGLSIEAHRAQGGYGMGYHEWQPMTAEQITQAVAAVTR